VEAQSVDASQPFDLRWEKTGRRGVGDSLSLAIYATDTARLFFQDGISLEQTNLTIPAGTLWPNTIHSAKLTLTHRFGPTNSSAQTQSVALEKRTTRFSIKTLNPAGVFKISPVCVVAEENAGAAIITVLRTEGSQGEATVGYSSGDGTARWHENYIPAYGILSFPDGVSNQTFSVSLLNDGVSNRPLTVQFTLGYAPFISRLITIEPHGILTILDSTSTPGQNVNGALVGKVEFYSQTNAAPPSQHPLAVTSRFYASVRPTFPAAVIGATLKLPDGTGRGLVQTFANYQGFFEFTEDFPSSTAMNRAYRPGKYQLSFNTISDGMLSSTIALGSERGFSIPHLTNWVQAQNIDPTMPFTLQWMPFKGATSNDFVRVTVQDSAGEYTVYTPDELMPDALPGTTLSYTIPANKLVYDRTYPVNIMFSKVLGLSTNSETGFLSAEALVHSTKLVIRTKIGPVPEPEIGFIIFVRDQFGEYVTRLVPVSYALFSNEEIIAIRGTDGAATHFTYGPTPTGVDTIPDPTPTVGSTPPLYRDGYPFPPASFIYPQPDVTVKAMSFAPGRTNSGIAVARIRWKVDGPRIIGNDATSLVVTNSTLRAQMWFTVDGSDPTNGIPSLGPIPNPATLSFSPTNDFTLKIRGFKSNYEPSDIGSRTFLATNSAATARAP
jgi:hypothetical protein